MKMLVLDDSDERLEAFRKNNHGLEVVCVKTAKEAIAELQKGGWDIVCLDHDLGGKVYCPSDEHSGYWVAKFLNQNPQFKPTMAILLHSLNPAGRKNMKAELPEAYEAPLCWIKPIVKDMTGDEPQAHDL